MTKTVTLNEKRYEVVRRWKEGEKQFHLRRLLEEGVEPPSDIVRDMKEATHHHYMMSLKEITDG